MKAKSPFRDLILGTETLVPLLNNKLVKYINFDNAATTPPLKVVMDSINNFAPWYSSIHRGKGYKSLLSTKLYEDSRQLITSFVNASPEKDIVIYVNNTTEAINKLSHRLCQEEKEKCVILSTEMEHHSNDLPWRDKFTLDYIAVNQAGLLSLEDLEGKLIQYQGQVKLVTVTGASNVTGYINPLREISGLCHQYGARLLVDGAQLVPHEPVDMQKEGIDFLIFSGHKIYAPFGAGVLIGPREFFLQGAPDYPGGGTVQVVTRKEVYWEDPPQKDEGGTPNLMGVIALAEAIKKLQEIGMERIAAYERELTQYTLKYLKEIPGIKLYTDLSVDKRVAIIPFQLDNLSHEDTAEILATKYGIAVRNGCFCAQPYIQKLLKVPAREIKRHIKDPHGLRPGLVRISFAFYNQKEEVDYLLEALDTIAKK